MVLVDTVILSYSLRRRDESLNVEERLMKASLKRLMETSQAQVIGPIRQEVLSGIRDERQFGLLQDAMRAFPNVILRRRDFEEAARLSNICRGHGIAGNPTDFLICSVSLTRGWQVFTADKDFRLYAKHLPIVLFEA